MFHVEIKRSYHRARAFNLDDVGQLIEAWREGRTVALGDREWEPRESRLTVLDGPALDTQQLAHGQGWPNAERSGRDVTAELLAARRAPATVTVVAADERVAAALTRSLGLPTVPWAAVRERVLAGERAGVDAAVIAVDADPAGTLDAGIALGAFGPRALVVQLGERPLPPPLAALAPLRVEPGDAAAHAHALAERLRAMR